MIPTTIIDKELEIMDDEPTTYDYKECNTIFLNQCRLNQHLKTNPYCNLLNEIRKHALIKCRNPNCNTWWEMKRKK